MKHQNLQGSYSNLPPYQSKPKIKTPLYKQKSLHNHNNTALNTDLKNNIVHYYFQKTSKNTHRTPTESVLCTKPQILVMFNLQNVFEGDIFVDISRTFSLVTIPKATITRPARLDLVR